MVKKINLYYQKKFSLKNRTVLKGNISKIFKAEKTAFKHVSVIFCSDNYLLSLNKNFLDHDYYTDVITFPLNEPGTRIEGEVYISVDRVKENARLNKTPFSTELKRVVYHGILHLCGYDDRTRVDKTRMQTKEDLYLTRFIPLTSH